MKDTSGTKVLGRTSAKRLGLALVPALAGAGILGVMMANGAIASSFAVSGQTFHLTADKIDGSDFAQFGSISAKVDGTEIPVAVSGFKTATITNLCQSVQTDMTPFGLNETVWIYLKASSATAQNLIIDMQQLKAGSAVFTNINIGEDASKLEINDPGEQGVPGLFGQQADQAVLTGVDQTANATNAGTFTLNGMSLQLQINGADPCSN